MRKSDNSIVEVISNFSFTLVSHNKRDKPFAPFHVVSIRLPEESYAFLFVAQGRKI